VTLLATLGECYCVLDQREKGWSHLRKALALAKQLADRRGISYSYHKMASVCLRDRQVKEGFDFLARSNLEAEREPETYRDILFANTYLLWEQARRGGNQTQAKIAFGRLKHLRSHIERRLPEVQKFDDFLRRSQDHVD
jgi:hypothetical protein